MTRVAIEHLLNLYERTHGPAGDVQTVARAALSAMDERDRLEAQVAKQAQEREVLRRDRDALRQAIVEDWDYSDLYALATATKDTP